MIYLTDWLAGITEKSLDLSKCMHQVTHLVIDVCRVRNRLGDFSSQNLPESLA